MTTTETRTTVRGLRSAVELAVDQLRGIDAWNAARRAEPAALPPTESREDRLDAARRADVRQRQHQALLDWTERQLRAAGELMPAEPWPRAVVAHRNEWYRRAVTKALTAGGVRVLAELDNGADAVGIAVAEQPDLLLVEDKLAMITGAQVVAEVLTYSPATVVVAQVEHDWQMAPMLQAGARAAFARKVPPAEVADALIGLADAQHLTRSEE